MDDIKIERMRLQHIAQVAEIHARVLKDDFLPSMGVNFLSQIYYPSCANNPYADVLVAVNGNKVFGFVNIAKDPNQYLRVVIKKNVFLVAYYLLKLLLLKPNRFLEAFFISRSNLSKPEVAGEIAFIAVDPRKQSKGVGTKLIEAANDIFFNMGLKCAFTKTLLKNQKVIQMYNNFGARIVEQFNILNKTYVYLLWDVKGENQK